MGAHGEMYRRFLDVSVYVRRAADGTSDEPYKASLNVEVNGAEAVFKVYRPRRWRRDVWMFDVSRDWFFLSTPVFTADVSTSYAHALPETQVQGDFDEEWWAKRRPSLRQRIRTIVQR